MDENPFIKLLLFQKYPLWLWDLQISREKKKRAGLVESYKWWLKGLEKDLLKEVKRMDIIQHED